MCGLRNWRRLRIRWIGGLLWWWWWRWWLLILVLSWILALVLRLWLILVLGLLLLLLLVILLARILRLGRLRRRLRAAEEFLAFVLEIFQLGFELRERVFQRHDDESSAEILARRLLFARRRTTCFTSVGYRCETGPESSLDVVDIIDVVGVDKTCGRSV